MSNEFRPGKDHPKHIPLETIQERLDFLQLNRLTLLKDTLVREKRYRFIKAVCGYCLVEKKYYVDSLLSGKTTGCGCQRNRKYGGDPRAEMLGLRYDCMIQRCSRDSHKQAKDYKDRGITVNFESREHFVRWALETFPNTNFKGLEFDRIDNDGPYSPNNLQLLTSKEHHRKRADNVFLSFNGKTLYWADWPSPYSPRRTQAFAASGLSGEEIIEKAQRACRGKCKGWLRMFGRLKELGYV